MNVLKDMRPIDQALQAARTKAQETWPRIRALTTIGPCEADDAALSIATRSQDTIFHMPNYKCVHGQVPSVAWEKVGKTWEFVLYSYEQREAMSESGAHEVGLLQAPFTKKGGLCIGEMPSFMRAFIISSHALSDLRRAVDAQVEAQRFLMEDAAAHLLGVLSGEKEQGGLNG